MSTPEAPATPAVQIAEAKTWLQKHERLVVLVLLLCISGFLGHKWIDHHYEVAKAKASAAAQVLTTQQDINKQLQQNYAALQKQQDQVNAQLQAQNVQLADQAAQAYKTAAAQVVADQHATNETLAARLGELTNQTGIQSNPSGVNLNHDQAAGTAGTLEQIPALKQQIVDDQQIKSNDEKQITGLTTEVNSCNLSVDGLKKQVTDQDTSCKAQVKELKAKNLKSKVKWTLGGFVVGFISGLTAHAW